MNPQAIGTVYKDTIYQRLRSLKVSYMLASYDFYNDKGALHRGEKVVIEGQAAEGFTRIVTGTGAVYVIPSHIIKKIQ